VRWAANKLKISQQATVLRLEQINLYTDLKTGSTYIAEPARRGARVLRWSRMPARERGADCPIDRIVVPLHLRQAAAVHFGWSL
jgi:hypothetical protein